MRGAINVLKPPGMTSHDVIKFLRNQLQFKKIGHCGTLDPVAAGVLPVFIGRATKAIEFFMEDDKEYVAELIFGVTTDTGDLEGNITNICQPNIDRFRLKEILKEFTGEIIQIPPMYSAVRHKGKKLYELARQGVTVERNPRTVKIDSLDLLDFDEKKALVKVACSKGTYIRTLCEDIGRKLGCGACLSCLVRTRSGFFLIENSVTLEEIKEYVDTDRAKELLTPVDQWLQNMPVIELFREDTNFFTKGNIVKGRFNFLTDYDGKFVRIYNYGVFLGIAVVERHKEQINLKVFKTLY